MPRARLSVKRDPVSQPLDPSYLHIALTQGKIALVDAVDFDWLNQWNWCAHYNKNSGLWYAERVDVSTGRRITYAMHRMILGCSSEERGDHKNGDGLDNRRNNLRKCTQADNAKNHRRYQTNKSGFSGVAFVSKNCWRAYINADKVRKHLGCYRTPEEASKAYQAAAIELFGEFNRQ